MAPVLVAAAACGAETVARPPPPPVDWASFEGRAEPVAAKAMVASPPERSAALAYIEALASPQFRDLGRVLDEEAHFMYAGFRDARGRDRVVNAHRGLLGLFAERRFVLRRVLLTDSSQAVEWTMTADDAASHRPVGINGLSLLWTKDDGSVTDIHAYYDDAVLQAQAGRGPKALSGLLPTATPLETAGALIEQGRTAEENDNVALVRALLDAFASGDEGAYVAKLSDDVEVVTPESSQPSRGKERERAYVRSMHRAIGHIDAMVDNAWGVGPFVVAEYHIVGEQRAAIGLVPARKENLVKMFIVDVVELVQGKIARIARYDNPTQILESPEQNAP